MIERTDGPVRFTTTTSRCMFCKKHKMRMTRSGVNPQHAHFCGAMGPPVDETIFIPIPEGHRYIGALDTTPGWCPKMDNLVNLESLSPMGEKKERL